MKNRFILFLITLLVLTSTNISVAENQKEYELSLYAGSQMSLMSYISQHNIEFVFDDKTVVQNLNANVVSINDSFIINGKDVGKSILIVSNSKEAFQLNVIVESPIESVELESNRITLLLGEIYELKYIVKQKEMIHDFSPTDIKWTSNKPHVASIIDGNKIYTDAVGTATFTGKTENNEVTLSFDLTVLGHGHKLMLSSENRVRQLDVGQKLSLAARLGTKDVTDNVLWESLTPHIVTVDDKGIVTAIGQGSGEIQAKTSAGNNKATYKLDAYSMIDYVTLNHSSIKFKAVGQTQQLMFNLYPKDRNNPPLLTGYHYVSSNEKVASVTDTGLIRAEGPGLTLISIVFDDSQKRASCTVEVPDNYIIPASNYVPLKEIDLFQYEGTAVIGEKISLNYLLTPENASDKEVTFNIAFGDDKQIQKINDQYYFIPSKRGNIEIEVVGADEASDKISIPVTSPIESLDLGLSTRRILSTNSEKIYIGETAELLTKYYAKQGFEPSDILPTSLLYEVKNTSIADLFIEDNKYYIRGLKAGKTEVNLTNLEGLHKTTLWIEVEDPIISISSDDIVELPIGIYYNPRVSANTISVTKGLSESFNLKDMIEYEVDNIYLSEEFIDNEISYEQEALIKYENKTLNSVELKERSSHESRLSQLTQYKYKASDGYVLLYDIHLLKDRNGRSYKYYTVKNTQIQSIYPVKLDISIRVKDTNYKAKTTLIWGEDVTKFQIRKLNSVFDVETLVNQYGLNYSIGELPIAEQTNLLVTYINYREIFDEIPNYQLLDVVYKLSNDEFLACCIKPLNERVTKEDLAELSVALHRKYVNRSYQLMENLSIYYYDLIDGSLEEAIDLGYVTPSSIYSFGSNQGITEKELRNVIEKIVPNNKSGTFYNDTKEMVFKDWLLILGELIQ